MVQVAQSIRAAFEPQFDLVVWRQPFDLSKGMPVESMETGQHSSMVEKERPLEQRFSSVDPGASLAALPDLAAAGLNAYEYLIRHGLQEGRAL